MWYRATFLQWRALEALGIYRDIGRSDVMSGCVTGESERDYF